MDKLKLKATRVFMELSYLQANAVGKSKMRSTSKVVEWWKKKRAKRTKNVLQCPMC